MKPVADTANNSGGDNSSAIIVAPDKDVPSSEEAANDGAARDRLHGSARLARHGQCRKCRCRPKYDQWAVAEFRCGCARVWAWAGGGMADSLMGRGGGGYGYGGYYGSMPFVDTEFVLQTELPTEPLAANVGDPV